MAALLVAVTQARKHSLAVNGALGVAEVLVVGVTCKHFEALVVIFVNIHAPQVDWAFQILIQVGEVHLHGLLQSVHRIVIAADVQVVVVHHHVGCAGTARSEAPLVLGAICRIADQWLEGPLAGALIPRATEQSEGLLGVLALAGHHGDIQIALEADHIPHAAAEHVVGHSTCRIVVQALILSGDGGERILTCGWVRGSHDSGAVVGNHAGDELVIDNGQATNTSGVSLLQTSGHGRGAIHDFSGVSLRVDFQQVRLTLCGGSKVQLVMEFDGGTIAVDRMFSANRIDDDLYFTGLDIDLEQQAVVLAVVKEQFAVESNIQCRLDAGIGGAHGFGHELQCGTHCGIASAHIHPVAITDRRP